MKTLGFCTSVFGIFTCAFGLSLPLARPSVQFREHPEKTRNAFAWYLGSSYQKEEYACAVLVAAKQVMNTSKRQDVDFVVVHHGGVPGVEKFKRLGIRLIDVPLPAARGKRQWADSFLKLRVAQLFEYKRIVYFDVDTFPLGNLENLFEISEFPIEIAAPRAYWLPQPFVQSGGPVVFDPETYFYSRDFEDVLDHSSRESNRYSGEMDWVNAHFKDSVTVLDGFYALLIGEWCGRDGVYRHWQKHFDQSSEWVYNHAALVHFIAGWKPWNFHDTDDLVMHMCVGQEQLELRKAIDAWWAVQRQVC